MDHRETVLFAPQALAIMSEDGGVFKSSKALVVYRDLHSSTLILERADGQSRRLVLDLAASVQRERNDLTESGNFSSFTYMYSRHGVNLAFEAVPFWWGEPAAGAEEEKTVQSEDANESINAFEFILSQFTYALFSAARVGVDPEKEAAQAIIEQEEHDAESNNVAYGLEIAGKGLRTGLRATGRGVGAAIRYAGSAYTQAAVGLGAGKDGPREVKEEDLAYGNQQRENCEVFHAGARSVTGTILAPVRYLGMQAGQHASESDRSKTYEEAGEGQGGADAKERSAAEEMLWGAGNGFVHAFKGITEFVGEIGEAVGDTALHHSKAVYGEEYAERVTKLHVEGAGQVGLGLYKVGNVFSFGLVGIAADAVFEGGILLTALYEFLVGPVILHAWMDVSFPPSTSLKRLYVVLRPFSVSFYEDSSDFAGRPYRVIPTSLLDTIPQLRKRAAPAAESGPLVNCSNTSGALASGAASSADDLAQLEQRAIVSQASYVQRLTSIRSHVELCTVDCSSALLHPLVDRLSSAVESFMPLEVRDAEESHHDDEGAGEEALQEWFKELKAACLRVEEVSKKRSGASELAVTRRLGLLPKRKVYWFALDRLEVKKEEAQSHGNSRATSTEANVSPLVAEGGEGSGVSSFFTDKLSAATMTGARVRLTPVVTDQSLHVSSEEQWTEIVSLKSAAAGAVGELECDFPKDTKLELGHTASLDTGSSVDGVTSFLLTVKVATVYGRDNAELGRAYVPISALQAGGTEISVKLHKKGKRERIVGTLTVTAGFFDSQEEEETEV